MRESRDAGWFLPAAEVRAVYQWLSGEAMNEGSASWWHTSPLLEWPHGRWMLQWCRGVVAEHRSEMMRARMRERR